MAKHKCVKGEWGGATSAQLEFPYGGKMYTVSLEVVCPCKIEYKLVLLRNHIQVATRPVFSLDSLYGGFSRLSNQYPLEVRSELMPKLEDLFKRSEHICRQMKRRAAISAAA